MLLDRARDNLAARDFHEFLETPAALKIIESFGFVAGREARLLDDLRPKVTPLVRSLGPVRGASRLERLLVSGACAFRSFLNCEVLRPELAGTAQNRLEGRTLVVQDR